MGILALVLGLLGAVCTILGILVSVEVMPELAGLDWAFWFWLAVILLIGCIASAVGRPRYE